MAKALPIIAINPGGTLAENAPLMLHTRLEEMHRFAPLALHPDNIDDLHAMRIAAKRLRYTMEIFASAFQEGDAAREFNWLYDKVKAAQEQIGQIHDADVRVPLLQDYLHRHGRARPELRTGLETLIQAQRAQRDADYQSFVKAWTKLQGQGFKRRFLIALAQLAPTPNEPPAPPAPTPTQETVPAHAQK